MNEKVRKYLIDVARISDKLVYYSDLVKECDLNFDLTTKFGQKQLSDTLGEISEFEDKNGRPLVSAMAIYKDSKINDHGDGFYQLAETLGKGRFKQLRTDLYAFEQVKKSQEFWQNQMNYSAFYELSATEPSFFKIEDLEFFTEWQLKPYDPDDDNHSNAGERIKKTVWEKTFLLADKIVKKLPGYSAGDKKAIWLKPGKQIELDSRVLKMQFKHYTWIRIFRSGDKDKQVYFTFGIDAWEETKAFVFKIDCQRERGSKLTSEQIQNFNAIVTKAAKWNEITYTELMFHTWETLTDLCVDFIKSNIVHYDFIVNSLWNKTFDTKGLKNMLIMREVPDSKFESYPEVNRAFNEVDVDYERQSKENKKLGDMGEELVKEMEFNFLTDLGFFEEASKVRILKDGGGYDVLSFDENRRMKYIEVKTTTGAPLEKFYLTENEADFMRSNVGSYFIYRIYNFDTTNNFGECFVIADNIESRLLMKPKSYEVLIKKLK